MGVRTVAKHREGNKNIKKQRGDETEDLDRRQGKKVDGNDRKVNKIHIVQELCANAWIETGKMVL